MAEQHSQSIPKRRWLRFTTRGMLLAVTLLAVWLGYIVNSAQRQKRAVAEIRRLSKEANVVYDFQIDEDLQLSVIGRIQGDISPPLPDRIGLDLFHNVVGLHFSGGTTDETFKCAAQLSHLQTLSCRPNGITDEGVSYLAALRHLKTLNLRDRMPTHFEIRSLQQSSGDLPIVNRITDRAAPTIGRLQQLESLDLSGASITSAGVRELAGLTNLKELRLSCEGIDNGALSVIARFEKLEILSLDGSKVTGAGLASIESLKKLRLLTLSATAISDHDLSSIAHHDHLEAIDLSYTWVTPKGLLQLQHLASLETIWLVGVKGDFARVKQAMPQVRLAQE